MQALYRAQALYNSSASSITFLETGDHLISFYNPAQGFESEKRLRFIITVMYDLLNISISFALWWQNR